MDLKCCCRRNEESDILVRYPSHGEELERYGEHVMYYFIFSRIDTPPFTRTYNSKKAKPARGTLFLWYYM